MATTIQRFNLALFKRKFATMLKRAGNSIQNDLKSVCNVYNDTIVYKEKIVSSVNGLSVSMGLGGSAYYIAFVEWGTGIHMPDWWLPYKEKGGAIADVPRLPRKGKYISPRGKGNAWTDWGGHHHEGADRLFWKGGNPRGVLAAEGQHGKHRLRDSMTDYVMSGGLNPILTFAINEAIRGSLK